MELLDILAQAQSGQAVQQVAKQFGLSEEQSALAFEMLAPVTASGVRRNVGQEGGYDALINALSGGRHERYFDDPDAIQFGNVAEDGNNILGHIFGSKDVSRGVAQQLSGSSGIGSAILKQVAAGYRFNGVGLAYQAHGRGLRRRIAVSSANNSVLLSASPGRGPVAAAAAGLETS